jgi:hypothetical protein
MGATRGADGIDRLKEPGGGVARANVVGTFGVGKGHSGHEFRLLGDERLNLSLSRIEIKILKF